MFKINFEKIQKTPIKGVYFDNNFYNIPTNDYKYLPISFIDEGVDDHLNLILFTLKEYFTNNNRFNGWKSFSKIELLNLIQDDKQIYLSQYDPDFFEKFTEFINIFLELYCDKH